MYLYQIFQQAMLYRKKIRKKKVKNTFKTSIFSIPNMKHDFQG